MELFIHIGTNKTGSSYLQTLSARNQSYLIENKIYFPIYERGEEMLAGKITAGNAKELAESLLEYKASRVKKYLQKALNGAKKYGCTKVFLSNERIVNSLVLKDRSELLFKIATQVGFKSVNCLLFLRDPVSHAISLYRHKAKSGKILDFKVWLEKNYETLEVIKKLPDIIDSIQYINWHLEKYDKNSEIIQKILFDDWLKVSLPSTNYNLKVNESLSISELKIIQTLESTFPNISHCLIKELSSNTEKADDNLVKKQYEYQAYQILLKYEYIFDKINLYLPDSKKTKILAESTENSNIIYSFSENQMSKISSALNYYSKNKLYIRIKAIFSSIKKLLSLK